MRKFEQLSLALPEAIRQEITWVYLVKYDKEYGKLLFLIAERRSNGQATFPGGKIEKGENTISGAIREVKEETNLAYDDCDLIPMGSIVSSSGGTTCIARTFLAFFGEFDKSAIVNLEPEKHSFWQWISIQDMLKNPRLHFVLQLIMQENYLLHIILETFFLESRNFENQILPAAFMEECRNIRIDEAFRDFAMQALS